MALAIPMGYLNLEDNMVFQWASLLGLLLFTGEFGRGRKVPYYTAPHTNPHTTLNLNKNREALRQTK
jgi:hypothetical protein